MLRFDRMFKTGSHDIAKEVLDLILVKLTQKKLARKSTYPSASNGEIVKTEYANGWPHAKENYKHALDTLAKVIKSNLNLANYDQLDAEIKKNVLNMLTNETFDLIEKQFFLKYVGARFSSLKETEKTKFDITFYAFSFDLYGKTQLELLLTEHLKSCFDKIKIILDPAGTENKPVAQSLQRLP